MPINHAGTLTVDYFISYLNLMMLSRKISLEEAVTSMTAEFFEGNTAIYGEETEANFKEAVQKLEQR